MPYKTAINKTEYELVEGLKKQDTHSYGELFDKYSPLILTLLKELNLNDQKMEEVLLACFINISNTIHQFDPSKQRLITWVIGQSRLTINQTCAVEKQELKIHDKINYVEKDRDLLNPSLIHLFILHGGDLDELASLTGIKKEELMKVLRIHLSQLKK